MTGLENIVLTRKATITTCVVVWLAIAFIAALTFALHHGGTPTLIIANNESFFTQSHNFSISRSSREYTSFSNAATNESDINNITHNFQNELGSRYNDAGVLEIFENSHFVTSIEDPTHSNENTTIIDVPSSDHGDLFPLEYSDLLGFFLAFFSLVLAAGGGIGGGGILVPVYILILGFLPKHAIPLSNVTVLGGAIANFLKNASKRHPEADRPLIDWDLILVMEPATLGGALVGANLNKILSETMVAVMLAVLLTFTACGTLKKATKMYQKESEERNGNADRDVLDDYILLNEDNDEDEWETTTDIDFPGRIGSSSPSLDGSYPQPPPFSKIYDKEDENYPEFGNPLLLHQILEEERHPNTQNVILYTAMFSVVILINILKGGGGFHSPLGIECGSAAFWVAQTVLLLWILFISLTGRHYLMQQTARKKEAGYPFLPQDIRWDARSTVVYPMISSMAGFCAGMFGVGGGIIKGPLMLAIGVHPAVASATSATMILFTSFTATTTFSVYGLLVYDYGLVCVVLGFVSTLIGQSLMTRLLARFQRNSFIAYSIAIVVLLSAFLMTLQSVLELASDQSDGELSGVCD